MAATTHDAPPANELYWHSSLTIDEVVEQLGISRNALYASILPIPAGGPCEECGGSLVFTNRTNRSRGIATCADCSLEVELPDEPEEPESAPEMVQALHQDHGASEAPAWSRWRDDFASVGPARYALVGGAAALGIIVGAAAVRAMR